MLRSCHLMLTRQSMVMDESYPMMNDNAVNETYPTFVDNELQMAIHDSDHTNTAYPHHHHDHRHPPAACV